MQEDMQMKLSKAFELKGIIDSLSEEDLQFLESYIYDIRGESKAEKENAYKAAPGISPLELHFGVKPKRKYNKKKKGKKRGPYKKRKSDLKVLVFQKKKKPGEHGYRKQEMKKVVALADKQGLTITQAAKELDWMISGKDHVTAKELGFKGKKGKPGRARGTKNKIRKSKLKASSDPDYKKRLEKDNEYMKKAIPKESESIRQRRMCVMCLQNEVDKKGDMCEECEAKYNQGA